MESNPIAEWPATHSFSCCSQLTAKDVYLPPGLLVQNMLDQVVTHWKYGRSCGRNVCGMWWGWSVLHMHNVGCELVCVWHGRCIMVCTGHHAGPTLVEGGLPQPPFSLLLPPLKLFWLPLKLVWPPLKLVWPPLKLVWPPLKLIWPPLTAGPAQAIFNDIHEDDIINR